MRTAEVVVSRLFLLYAITILYIDKKLKDP
jgi:hypothetical protein